MTRFRFLLPFFFGIVSILEAQKPLEKGKILDSIPVNTSDHETFALYLPSSFNENTLNPVVFVFEPAARGKIGVQPFISSAEKYGLIVICSNSSRNGPFDRNFDVANNLFNTVFNQFPIKEDEMFIAGFSGGSRLATAIACVTDKFFGVIACGAGFSSVPAYIPSLQKFLYAGLVGTADMNYSEMLRNKKLLGELNFTNTLFTFEAGHSWPATVEISRAFDWLYLQHPDKQKDPSFSNTLSKQFEHTYHLAVAFEDTGKLLFAAENYERIIASYTTFFDIDSIINRYNRLSKSKPFKKANKQLYKALTFENKLRNKLLTKLNSDLQQPSNIDLPWWKKEVADLNALGDESSNSAMKNMVKRLKFVIVASVYERNGSDTDNWNDVQRKMFREIREIVFPSDTQ